MWHKVADVDALADGRVMTVTAGRVSLALTRFNDRYGALDNHCPHQGGPLGEGSIEKGWLRCPWHGYDYDPITGTPPPGFTDAPASHPGRGARRRHLRRAAARAAARRAPISDLMVETMIAWGVTHVFGMVGHSNLGFADAMREAETRGDLTYIGIRHEGAAAFAASAYGKLTGQLAACFAIAGPGSTNLLTGSVRRQGRPRAGARDLGPGAVEGARPRRVPGSRPRRRVRRRRGLDADRAARLRPRRADEPRVQARARAARRRAPRAARRGAGAARAPTRGRAARADASPISRSRRADAPVEQAAALIAGAKRPVIVVGHGARRGIDDVVRLAERLQRADPHHVQGEGHRRRRSPARVRCARPQRHAGRVVAHERVRSADRVRRVVREPHRHRVVQADHPGRRRSRRDRSLPPRHRADARRCRRHGAPPARRRSTRAACRRVDQRADVAARCAIWHAEKERRAPTTAVAASRRRRCSTRSPAHARQRGDRGRRRQQHVLVRPLLRVQARPARADVGLPRLDRLRLPGRDGRVGRRARPARSSPSPATAASVSTSPRSPPR